jgi:hypothetical protein
VDLADPRRLHPAAAGQAAGGRPAPAVGEAEPAEQAHPGPRPPRLSAPAPAGSMPRQSTEILPPRPGTTTRPQEHPAHPALRRAHRPQTRHYETANEEVNNPTTPPHRLKIKLDSDSRDLEFNSSDLRKHPPEPLECVPPVRYVLTPWLWGACLVASRDQSVSESVTWSAPEEEDGQRSITVTTRSRSSVDTNESPSGIGHVGAGRTGSWAVEQGLRGLPCQHRLDLSELKQLLPIGPTPNCQQTKGHEQGGPGWRRHGPRRGG